MRPANICNRLPPNCIRMVRHVIHNQLPRLGGKGIGVGTGPAAGAPPFCGRRRRGVSVRGRHGAPFLSSCSTPSTPCMWARSHCSTARRLTRISVAQARTGASSPRAIMRRTVQALTDHRAATSATRSHRVGAEDPDPATNSENPAARRVLRAAARAGAGGEDISGCAENGGGPGPVSCADPHHRGQTIPRPDHISGPPNRCC